MTWSERVLVVGTTPDYISLLHERFGERLVFLTDFQERSTGILPKAEISEILCDCEDHDSAVLALRGFLNSKNIGLTGLMCFDCESLALSAVIAAKFGLEFVSLESVLNCRSKFRSKELWANAGVPTPRADIVSNIDEALYHFHSYDNGAVIKPLTGSGSELVFYSKTVDDCKSDLHTVITHISGHLNKRMYSGRYLSGEHDPRSVAVIEEYIGGEEYSCDFVYSRGSAQVIRFGRKNISTDGAFGTVSYYQLPAQYPKGWDRKKFEGLLGAASEALGLSRMIAMADLKYYQGKFYILELSPRPGGDCLPALVKAGCGYDIFRAVFEFAEGGEVRIPRANDWREVCGVPVIATKEGALEIMDVTKLRDDPRVISVEFKRKPGDRISLPPVDYDSRTLGYILFYPDNGKNTEMQCREILEKVTITIKENSTVGPIS